MDDQLERVIEVLHALALGRAYQAIEARGDHHSDLTQLLLQLFPPVVDTVFDGVRKMVDDALPVDIKFVHLPLTGRDSLAPILQMQIVPRDEGPALSFCIGLYRGELRGGGRPPTFQAAAYRFEPPEGTAAEQSEHGYYHAQPSASYGRDGPSVRGPNLMSTRLPAFPLSATTPVELLIAALVSVYGRRKAREVIQALAVAPLPGRWPGYEGIEA